MRTLPELPGLRGDLGLAGSMPISLELLIERVGLAGVLENKPNSFSAEIGGSIPTGRSFLRLISLSITSLERLVCVLLDNKLHDTVG